MPRSPQLRLLAQGHLGLPVARDANPQGGGRTCFSTGKELKFGRQRNLWPTVSWSQQLPFLMVAPWDGSRPNYLCRFFTL